MALLAKVQKFLDDEGLAAASLVVAVSGGPDSMALLHALLALRRADDGPFVLAHFNHRLRGPNSDADEAFVRRAFASVQEQHGVSLECSSADVAAVARAEHGNLEAVSRRLRYAWLADIAEEHCCRFVATGHTADDQAETVLHRILRGAGLRGVAGIPARRPLKIRAGAPIEVIRPLLRVTRSEVLEFLTEVSIAYRTDASNLDRRFTRNRLRHELLPLLARDYNPAITSVLCRLAEQAAAAYREEETSAAALLVAAELPRAGSVLVFDRQRLTTAPQHVVRALFRLVWEREQWPRGHMGFEQWERLAEIVKSEEKAGDLPGGVRARLRDRVVQLEGPS